MVRSLSRLSAVPYNYWDNDFFGARVQDDGRLSGGYNPVTKPIGGQIMAAEDVVANVLMLFGRISSVSGRTINEVVVRTQLPSLGKDSAKTSATVTFGI